jgi:four helix bundle protein
MSRDHRKLEAFVLADALVLDVYRATRGFPVEERYALQTQLRRGAVSVPTNIVEGSTRTSEREYRHFVVIALGSASEVRYLVSIAARLDMLDEATARQITHDYNRVIRALQGLVSYLDRRAEPTEVRGPKSEVHPRRR